jgi:hypothetical protein
LIRAWTQIEVAPVAGNVVETRMQLKNPTALNAGFLEKVEVSLAQMQLTLINKGVRLPDYGEEK